MKSFNEPAQNVPLLDDVDVVVCGAGPAGCSAAIAAARLGARTLLLERDGYLGGATVSQLVAHILSTNAMDFQGIWHEWIHAIRRRRTDAVAPLIGTPGKYFFRSGVDPEVVKFAWQDLLDAAGVEVLFHTWASNAALDGSTCQGVVAETCAGRRAILAKRVIDCTGNGSVCAAAGVPFTHGNGTDNWNQALTMVYRMANVQWPEKGYSGADMDRIKALAREHAEPTGPTTPVLSNGRVANYAMANWVHQSVAPYRKEMNVFSSRILKVDPLDPRELSRAEREGRDQAWQCAEFIRRNIPGFEQSYLLVAGRCLSAEREAEASLRIQQTCASTGQAAGVAAALSLRNNVTPRILDAGKVVAQLAADRASVEPAWPILAKS